MSHHNLMKAELVNARFLDLIKIRLPWLIIGLFGSFIVCIVVSKFEISLRETIAIAFFIPIIANMSDGIGTQTETIFIRALTDLKFNILNYILRELLVGMVLGLVLGVIASFFGYFLGGSIVIGLVVGLSLFLSLSTATVLACLTPILLKSFGKDPAVGSGPFTTSLQDLVSLTIYLVVASLIL